MMNNSPLVVAKFCVKVKMIKKVITVEDHYLYGGLGQMVASALINNQVTLTMLAVTRGSRSGLPEELLKDTGIDAENIVKAIKK